MTLRPKKYISKLPGHWTFSFQHTSSYYFHIMPRKIVKIRKIEMDVICIYVYIIHTIALQTKII